MKIAEVLKVKGPEVMTIGQDKQLSQALELLVKNSIGVLLVIDSDAKICGILSERDILRASYHDPAHYRSRIVKEFMTKEVIFVEAEDEIEYAESIMTQNRIRHLPVMNNKVLVGLISIGDVVKGLLKDKRFENKYLMDYISGNLPNA